jgi:hypothetical protein
VNSERDFVVSSLSLAIVEFFNKQFDLVDEHEKKRIIAEVIAKIRNSGGRFLKWSQERNDFYEINADATETKVNRALTYRKLRDGQKCHSRMTSNAFYQGKNSDDKPKKTMSDITKLQSSFLQEGAIFGTTFPDSAASKDHDTVPKHSIQLEDTTAENIELLPSESQSMHYKQMIQQRQPPECLPQFHHHHHNNISIELQKAHEEIDLLRAKIKVYNDRKMKLQQKIHEMRQQHGRALPMITTTMHPHNCNHSVMVHHDSMEQYVHHLPPYTTNKGNPRCDFGTLLSLSEDESSEDDFDDLFQDNIASSKVSGNNRFRTVHR